MTFKKFMSATLAITLAAGFAGINSSSDNKYNTKSLVAYADDKNTQGYTKLNTLTDDKSVPSPSVKSTSGLTYIEDVLIVNKKYGLPSSYEPNGGNLENVCETQFKKMQSAAKNDGKTLTLALGYVSYSDWENQFGSSSDDMAEKIKAWSGVDVKKLTESVIEEAGHSEFQSGLSVAIKTGKNSKISDDFDNTAEYKWLKSNAHNYGFIERYPEGEEDYTGLKARPYQWRYVGKAKATALHNAGVSLEHYLGIRSDDTLSGPDGSSGASDGDRTWKSNGSSEDPDWLVSKDDWRHGITHDNGGDGQLVQYKLGMASGKFAISLEDGKWYWYHQGNDACDYCGDWSDKIWANNEPLSKSGGAVYALSIAVSNLTNTATTPSDLLVATGAKNGNKFDLSGSSVFKTDGSLKSVDDVKSFLESKYDLDVTKISIDNKDSCKSAITKILNKGGMVILRHNSSSKGTWWPAADLSSHFICIRKTASGKYYILDSLIKDFDKMNNGIDFDTIWNNMIRNGSDTYLLGVVNPNVIMLGGGSSAGNWITDAASIGTYKNTISLGSDGSQKFYLYDGLPWKYETGTYFVDLNQAAIDLESYVSSVSSNKNMQSGMGYNSMDEIVNVTGNWISTRATNQADYPTSAMQGNFTSGNSGYYKVIDGLPCVGFGPPPVVVDKNYNINFGPAKDGENLWLTQTTPSASLYGYGTRKYCGVFKDISGGANDGKLYYLPLSATDAKAHTFPGGIGQTGICMNNNYSADASGRLTLDSSGNPTKINNVYVAEHGYDFATSITNKPWSSLMDIMNTKYHYSSSDNVTQWDRLWNIGEFTRVPGCVASKVITSGDYKLIGFIAYPN